MIKMPTEIKRVTRAEQVSRVAAGRQAEITFPKMIDVEGQTYKRIMVGELTVGEFRQFVRPREISGWQAKALRACMKGPREVALTYVNKDDVEKFIDRANKQDRKFRFMTEPEFETLLRSPEIKSQLKANENLGNVFLVGVNFGGGHWHCWRQLCNDFKSPEDSNDRYRSHTVRLVED
jgi:hypothetical protein